MKLVARLRSSLSSAQGLEWGEDMQTSYPANTSDVSPLHPPFPCSPCSCSNTTSVLVNYSLSFNDFVRDKVV